GRGGRGAANPDRPGETPPVAQQARGGGGGGRGGGRGGGGGFGNIEGELGDVLREMAQQLQREGLNIGGGRGGRGGGRGGGGGGGALADPGQYTVVLRAGSTTQSQTLRFERIGSAGG